MHEIFEVIFVVKKSAAEVISEVDSDDQPNGWRKAECARTLGVARGYLHRLINQLGIQEGEGDPAPERREDYPLGPVM